jgi:cell division protein FtsN
MQDLGRYTKRTHIEIQTKYLSFLAVVSIALVGVVFALGVLVGSRQSKRQSACPKLDALAVLDSQSKEPMPMPAPRITDLSFHESLEKIPNSVPTPASLIGGPGAEQKNAAAAVKKRSDVTVDTVPKMNEPPIPESVPQDEPGVYSLQVGSFKSRQEATEMVRQLQRAGYGAFFVSVDMPERGGLWYRVRVGPFHSKKEVWDKKKEFEERERIPTFVVKRRAEG